MFLIYGNYTKLLWTMLYCQSKKTTKIFANKKDVFEMLLIIGFVWNQEITENESKLINAFNTKIHHITFDKFERVHNPLIPRLYPDNVLFYF